MPSSTYTDGQNYYYTMGDGSYHYIVEITAETTLTPDYVNDYTLVL